MHSHTRQLFRGAAALAAFSLAAFAAAGRPSLAQTATQISAASSLSASDSTLTFTGTGTVPSYTGASGGNTLKFTATNGNLQFQTQDDLGGAFPTGTNLLEAEDGLGGSTGPLTITFATGVREFGLGAQDINNDTQTFTFVLVSGSRALGTFMVGPSDNTNGAGQTVFLGASAPAGFGITGVTIFSTSSSDRGSNLFAVGPVTFGTPAPEPSQPAALGLGALGLWALIVRRRRRVSWAGGGRAGLLTFLLSATTLGAAGAFTPTPGVPYRIEGKQSGGCLWGNIYNNSNKIEPYQQGYAGAASETFTFSPLGNGCYQIVQQSRGLVLECDPTNPNGSPAGKPIGAWLATPVNNALGQQWSLTDAGGGYVAIVNRQTGTVLTIDSGSLNTYARFQTAPNAGYDWQKFWVEEVRPGPVACIAVAPGYGTTASKRMVLCSNTDLGASTTGTLTGNGASHTVTFTSAENLWGQYYYVYTDTTLAQAAGTYTISAAGFPSSTFIVADTVYRTVPGQRGVSWISNLENGFFARQRINDGETSLLNYLAVTGGTLTSQPGTTGDLHGGWYDATSYDMETAQEATALRNLSYAAQDALNTGDKTQLLSESSVGADFLVRLQNSDGSWPVSIKPTTDTPVTSVRKLLVNTDCGSASKCVLALAAAARALQSTDPALSAGCLAAAQKGWTWVAANRNNANSYITDSTIYPPGDWTGDADSILAAATDLAVTTGSAASLSNASSLFYEGQFSSSGLWVKRSGSYVRQTSGIFAAVALARLLPYTSGQLSLDIANQLTYYLSVMTANDTSSFGLNVGSFVAYRGNNERIAKAAYVYLNLYAALGDVTARNVALDHYNWILGTNPFGSSFVISSGGLNVMSAFFRPRPRSVGELLPGPEVSGVSSITLADSSAYATSEGAVSPTTLIPAFQMLMDRLTAVPPSAVIPVGKTISLKAMANGDFACADLNHATPPTLIANRTSASYWEWYTVVDEGSGYVALKSHANSLYVSTGTTGAGILTANAPTVTASETFQWENLGGGYVALKSVVSGKYVNADLKQIPAATLIANGATLTTSEVFQVTTY